MKKIREGLLFFIGWILSPLTLWNDAFVNIPLSYLMANLIFYITRLPFKWLLIGSYWFTNILGIYFMYFGGKGLIQTSKNRFKAVVYLIVFVVISSIIMLYLEEKWQLTIK